jgi:acyl carrier protein
MIVESATPGKKLVEVIRRIAEIIIDELKLEDVTPSTFDPDLDLIDELGIDSMDLTAVVLVLQDEYGITIYEEDYSELKTVRGIARYVLEQPSA